MIEARESSSADDVSIRMSHCSQSVVDSMIYGIFDLFLECQDQKCELKPVRVKYMLRVMRVELQNKLFIWEKTTDKFYINTYILATNSK